MTEIELELNKPNFKKKKKTRGKDEFCSVMFYADRQMLTKVFFQS